MKLISAIYDAPVYITNYNENYVGVAIFYDGHNWTGRAYLHPEDKDFYSPKVGRRIALSRARIKIMQYELKKMDEAIKQRELFYREVCGYGSKDYMEVDPTGSFRKNITRNKLRYEELLKKKEYEVRHLKNYLEGQRKAIATVKRMRASEQKDNNN